MSLEIGNYPLLSEICQKCYFFEILRVSIKLFFKTIDMTHKDQNWQFFSKRPIFFKNEEKFKEKVLCGCVIRAHSTKSLLIWCNGG